MSRSDWRNVPLQAALIAVASAIAATSTAAPSVQLSLQLTVDPAASCPEEGAVVAAIAREAGRSVLDAGASRRASLAIMARAGELHARIAFTDPSGREQAVRAVSAPSDRCVDLVRVFALLVALHVQAVETQPESPPVPKPASRPPPASEAPVPRPARVAAPAAEEPAPPTPGATRVPPPPPAPAVAPERASPPPPTAALQLGPLLRTGFAPGVTPGVRAEIAWHLRAPVRLGAAVDFLWPDRTRLAGGGGYEVRGGAVAVAACWTPRAGVLAVWWCPTVAGALVQVAGTGVDVPREDLTLSVSAGLDARVALQVSPRWSVEALLGGAVSPRPHEVWLDRVNVWTAPRVWFAAALLLGVHIY